MAIKYIKGKPDPNSSKIYVIEQVTHYDKSSGKALHVEKFPMHKQYKYQKIESDTKHTTPSFQNLKCNMKIQNTKNNEFSVLMYPDNFKHLYKILEDFALNEEYPKHKGDSKITKFSFMYDFSKLT